MESHNEKTFSPDLREQQMETARFFIVKLLQPSDSKVQTGNSFTSISPFLINKTFINFLGNFKSIKKLRSGDLLIEVSSSAQAQLLSKSKKIGMFDVDVTPHRSLNSSQGVISEKELLYVPENEILEELKDQNIINVRRITIRRDGKILPTKHLILTFNSPTLPSDIKAGYINCNIRPYIPNPLRCFKCGRFGHSQSSCRGTLTCARCSEPNHNSENCTKTPKCVNCKGDHPAYARSCPKWKFEKEIQAIKANQNISYPEARKIVEARTPSVGASYASAASKTFKSIGTQTLPESKPSLSPKKTKAPLENPAPRTVKSTSSQSDTHIKSPTSPKQNISPQRNSISQNRKTLSQIPKSLTNNGCTSNAKHSTISKSQILPSPATATCNKSKHNSPSLKRLQTTSKKQKIIPGIKGKNKDPRYMKTGKDLSRYATEELLLKLYPSEDEDEDDWNTVLQVTEIDPQPMEVTNSDKVS